MYTIEEPECESPIPEDLPDLIPIRHILFEDSDSSHDEERSEPDLMCHEPLPEDPSDELPDRDIPCSHRRASSPSSYFPLEFTSSPRVPRNFTPDFDLDLIRSFYEMLDRYEGIVRIETMFYTPVYTNPILHLCLQCVKKFCINYICFPVTDYIFPEDRSDSYRDSYYCMFCSRELITLHRVL